MCDADDPVVGSRLDDEGSEEVINHSFFTELCIHMNIVETGYSKQIFQWNYGFGINLEMNVNVNNYLQLPTTTTTVPFEL